MRGQPLTSVCAVAYARRRRTHAIIGIGNRQQPLRTSELIIIVISIASNRASHQLRLHVLVSLVYTCRSSPQW